MSENISEYKDKESGPRVEVHFDMKSEVGRVSDTIKNLAWYKENGYQENAYRLPVGVGVETAPEEIERLVGESFEEDKYFEAGEYIKNNWEILSRGLAELSSIGGFKIFDEYKIILSRYGTGGSYNSKNGEIIVNIDLRMPDKIMGTIAHEIVHIGIQHLIDQYHIKHWDKERLVDLVGERYFSGQRKMQNIEGAERVDRAFKQFFPDIEAVVSAIAKED
ncbi:MAG: hypothetical protein QG609_594 [Patescibacteria group bacterium]|nr:hypothetical protein [Patescibacteria group bacterium]MDQ5957754.1 hypothetical protein [Patescibacteria group bacterium]